MIFFTRTDPTRNVNRFYIVEVCFVNERSSASWLPRLPRSMWLDHFEHRADPDAAQRRIVKRRLQRS